MFKNNNSLQNTARQQQNPRTSHLSSCNKAFSGNVRQQILRVKSVDLERHINALCKNDQRTLFLLLCANNYFSRTKFSQQTIANFSGVLRQAAHKSVHRLQQRGLITFECKCIKNNVYDLLTYKVNPILMTPDAQFKLLPLFASKGLVPQSFFQFFSDRKLVKNSKTFLPEKRTQRSLLRNYKVILVSSSNSWTKSNSSLVRGALMKYDKAKILDQLRTNSLSEDPISPAVAAIAAIKLTFAGKIDLLGYPEQALTHAEKQMLKKSGVRNAHALFCKIAEDYCKDNGLVVDRSYVREVSALLRIRPDQPRVETHEIMGIAATPFADSTQSWNEKKKTDSGSTISFEEATRRNKQLMIMHAGSVEAAEEFSRVYEAARVPRDFQQVGATARIYKSVSVEPVENILKNLVALRQMEKEGNAFQKHIARTGIDALEKVLADRGGGGADVRSPHENERSL